MRACLGLAFVITSLAALGCASPPPPPKAAPPPPGAVVEPAPYVGTLVRLPRGADRVSLADHPVRPDGSPDFGFRVRLTGRVRAFYLLWSDGAGRTIDHMQWDTRTRGPCPKEIGSNFPYCGQTAVIGVVDSVDLLPDAGA